jgi:hypothetical protein
MQTGSSGTLIGWKSGQTTFVPLWDRMEGAWLRTRIANCDAVNSTVSTGTGIGITHSNTQHSCKQTRVHKIINVPVFYMELLLNGFETGKSITRVIGRGGLWKS